MLDSTWMGWSNITNWRQNSGSDDTLRTLFHSWWFDPLSATVSFASAMLFFWWFEHQQKVRQGTIPPDVHPMKVLVSYLPGDHMKATVAYWTGIMIWRVFVSPLNALDGFPEDLLSMTYLLSEVAAGLVAYDLVFFCLHWGMHHVWVAPHKVHHEVHNVEAHDVLRHSLVDGTLQVLVNILVQRTTPWGMTKTRLARLLHNILVTWMLTESHAACPTPRIFRRFCSGVRDHREHHTDGISRYQPFFGYLDRVRGQKHSSG